MSEEKKENNKTNKKRHCDPKKFAIKFVALTMAISMVFAVAATCIFYFKYYYM